MSRLKIYKASAGSGKTYTLAVEYIKELLLKNTEDNYRHILAVTFTKDATGEMKDRILAELYGLAFNTKDSRKFIGSVQDALAESNRTMGELQIRERAKSILETILHDYSRLYITTIDSFFQKVLRNLARELGKGSKFNIEMNTAKVRSDAVNRMIENAHTNPQLLSWLTTYVENKLDQDGNWRFRDEVYKFSACIYDEFFQEHESVLYSQLENNPAIFNDLKNKYYWLISEYKSFFKETYAEVLNILDKHQLSDKDFYRGTVINFWRKLSENPNTIGNTNYKRFLENSEGWVTKTHKRKNEIIALVDARLMDLLKETLSIQEKYETSKLILGNIHQLGLIWYITTEIDEMNFENNRFMLSDTAQFLNQMIDNSDSPFIYEKIGAEIQHVMIDEFQDTSRLQWSNFKSLLSDILSNNYFSMIVGDIKQSIYRWRNGDWRILSNITNELSVESKSLGSNYRSEKYVVDFNNSFFTQAGILLNQKFKEELSSLSNSPFSSVYKDTEVIQKVSKKEDEGFVSIDFLQDSEDEKYKDLVLIHLLGQIEKLCETGVEAEKICILVRNNNQIKLIAEYFSAQRVDYPELAVNNYLDIVSNEAFQLNSSLAVKIIMEALKTVAYPDNSINKAQLNFLLDAADPSGKLKQIEADNKHLSRMPLFELISYLHRIYHLEKIDGQSAYLFFFYDAINNYLKSNSSDINSFITFWENELFERTIPTGEGIKGIRAMTIHKSKGLQFHTVLIPYCTWELNPKFNPVIWCGKKEGVYDLELLPVNHTEKMNNTIFSTEYQYETSLSWLDNLNLLYVAFTRAENNLIVLGKYKKSLSTTDAVKSTSDLLQWIAPELDGKWDEKSLHYESGILTNSKKEIESVQDNLLKQVPPPMEISFTSEEFHADKSIFKQSNKSRDFIDPDSPSKDKYVEYGNIMHDIFAKIDTLSDIEKAVENLISDGIILPAEKEKYIDKIHNNIEHSDAKEWFSDKYKIYSEFSIIVKEKGEVTTKRPDRVLLSENSTIIIDYKFGEPRSSHKKQVMHYISLLEGMRYPNVEGYLWYVEENRIEKI